jgi:hypothetical protein
MFRLDSTAGRSVAGTLAARLRYGGDGEGPAGRRADWKAFVIFSFSPLTMLIALSSAVMIVSACLFILGYASTCVLFLACPFPSLTTSHTAGRPEFGRLSVKRPETTLARRLGRSPPPPTGAGTSFSRSSLPSSLATSDTPTATSSPVATSSAPSLSTSSFMSRLVSPSRCVFHSLRRRRRRCHRRCRRRCRRQFAN